jgi:general secretion pathway protein B
VGEGAQVAGARVVEIKEDRVRLSRGGQTFEVQLSSAAR